MDVFKRAWQHVVGRAEALHHAVACAGQDAQNLCVGQLRQLLKRHGAPLIIDRASPVYGATLLVEVCRARVDEARLCALAEYLLQEHAADPCARAHERACSPLMIASARGLPRLTALLLAHGADPLPTGDGRFKLLGCRATVSGTHTAIAFVRRLFAAEAERGIACAHRTSLLVCHELLRAAAAAQGDVPPAAEAYPREAARRALHEATRRSRESETGELSDVSMRVTDEVSAPET